jgi:hypothetical protein
VSEELLWLRYRAIREPRGRGTSAVGNRFRRTGEETADREQSVRAVVNC